MGKKSLTHAPPTVFLIPQRYVLGLMGFLAVVNAYTMRVSLSIAITEMVVPSNKSQHYDPNACVVEDDSDSTSTVTNPDKLYDWDETTQGLILSAFYWGYAITHLPGGILAEKFGGKYTLGLGILSTAFFTLITPWVINISDGNWIVLVILRLIEGLGEGTTYPALNALLAQWVPLDERAKIGTLVYAGGQIGTIVSNLISGALINATEDWASVFYLFGGLGMLWVLLWFLLCYSDPESHPFISEKEKKYLQTELERVSHDKKVIPWKAILTSVPLWALVAAQIGHDWGFYTMVTDLPKYMKDVLKFRVEENGVWSSLPYLVMWLVSMTSGWLCDWLIKKGYMGITIARKFFTAIAALGPAVFIIVASYSGCDRLMAVAMFTVAMGFMGTFYCGMKVNALDLSPNFAGTLMAITNGIGAITGIITPYLTGALTENHTLTEWRTVLWISFGIFVATSVVYIFFGSAEEQPWNSLERDENDIEAAAGKTERKKRKSEGEVKTEDK
ncbi:inorganic phosphate cotransporter [Asbolus verrucosus]|uniref:Inorganic phosphate cotransporter n=1 Tax=Asbolus verrucosus TaxID=1661398 RepID=A0A482V8N1_ASBVE|nr:inorganic phosphate cotransporter [Asbolus verrucosus]